MDIFEIDRKLKENLDLIAQKNTEISELQRNHNVLLQEKRVAKFELVVDSVEIGQVIELPQALAPLRYGDKIKIVRKNNRWEEHTSELQSHHYT